MQDAFWGILIPFLGTSRGAGCVFFLKNSLRDGIQHALTGFAAGVMVGGRKRNLFQNLRKCLNFLTEETAGRIILAEGPLRSGFL